jgi:hypothetical protein
MKRDEILSEFKKGIKARKYNRRYVDPDRESETLIAPRIPPKKKDDIKEQRTDYTKDEILAVLTRQKTQAEVDAEALRTRGPDKGNQPKPTTPPPKTVQTKETTGAPVGKITKVDPTTKKATVTKTDGTTQEVDPTALKPTPDGKMQMDAPDTDDLTNKEVVSTEDALAPPGDSRSPIHGDEDHDEVSKLLVNRLRKLAGLQEQPAPAPVQTTTPTTNPAAAPTSQIPDDITVAGMLDDSELSPDQKAIARKILVAQPNGTIDLARTVRNLSREMLELFPQIVDMMKDLQTKVHDAMEDPEFSKLASANQKVYIDLRDHLAAVIPQLESQIMQMAKKHDAFFNNMELQTGQYGDKQVQEADALHRYRQSRPNTDDQQLEAMLRIAGLR